MILSPFKRLRASQVLATASVLFVFAAGWLLGGQLERGKGELNLDKFWRVYSLITANYPGEINKEQAVDGAIAGLVESLGDPYSSYLSKEDFRLLNEDLKGEFEGIGAVLTLKDEQVVVVEPIAGSPAERAGLTKDDSIIKVDGEEVIGFALDDVVARIRGPKGSEVVLTIIRDNKELEVKITRDTIEVNSVSSQIKDGVGIIRITQFGDDTADGVMAAISSLEQQGAQKYLIDLRGNPGGYLNVVVEVAGMFLPPDSVVVQQVYQGGVSDKLETKKNPLLPNKPVFVFIDGGSASAAEILAGAIRDHNRGVLLGEKSYGKGSVQDVLNLRGSTGLRLTVAEWLTPNGDHINKVGIEPDHKIKDGSDEQELEAALKYIAKQ